jgi:hypothetical protein
MKFTREEENLIANLRGLPEHKQKNSYPKPGAPFNKRSFNESKYRGATIALSMDSLVETIIKHYKLDQPRPEKILMLHWADIVGHENACRCCPSKIIQKKQIIISVANPLIHRELIFQRSSILKRIQQYPGLETIHEIFFRVG